ncbi:hypothetical protein [Natrinema amylolyticum]|uniref:hypothetical protein n=1 Tax=Natrinema amylolyticum TaxID=2878679 RepID=UPI003CCD083F
MRDDFVTSKIVLREAAYGDAPASFVRDLGVPVKEWDGRGDVSVRRSCVLTPYLAHDETYAAYWMRRTRRTGGRPARRRAINSRKSMRNATVNRRCLLCSPSVPASIGRRCGYALVLDDGYERPAQ